MNAHIKITEYYNSTAGACFQLTDIECSEETADFCDTRAGLMTTVSEVEAGEAAEAEMEGGASTEAPVTKATRKNKKRAGKKKRKRGGSGGGGAQDITTTRSPTAAVFPTDELEMESTTTIIAPSMTSTMTPITTPTVAPTATPTVAPAVTPTVAPAVTPNVTPTVAQTPAPAPATSKKKKKKQNGRKKKKNRGRRAAKKGKRKGRKTKTASVQTTEPAPSIACVGGYAMSYPRGYVNRKLKFCENVDFIWDQNFLHCLE